MQAEMTIVSNVDQNQTTNGAENGLLMELPYAVEVTLKGACPILFHRWNNESVAAKSKLKKGSEGKKVDNIESYVWRCENGNIGIPAEYVRRAMIFSAKYHQDPRSPRKSAMDLYKAGIVALDEMADLGVSSWDYEDKRRVTIHGAGITRVRPAMKEGWQAKFLFQVLTPEYILPNDFNLILQQAGRLIGIGDFRPTYGRFMVNHFEVIKNH